MPPSWGTIKGGGPEGERSGPRAGTLASSALGGLVRGGVGRCLGAGAQAELRPDLRQAGLGTRQIVGRGIRRGLMPITIGLVFATATILMRTVNHVWRGYLITLFTVAVVLRQPWNPLWLFGVGALAGIVGFV